MVNSLQSLRVALKCVDCAVVFGDLDQPSLYADLPLGQCSMLARLSTALGISDSKTKPDKGDSKVRALLQLQRVDNCPALQEAKPAKKPKPAKQVAETALEIASSAADEKKGSPSADIAEEDVGLEGKGAQTVRSSAQR